MIDRELRRRLAERDEAVLDLVVQFGLTGLGDMVRRCWPRRQHIDWNAMAHRDGRGPARALGALLARRGAAAGGLSRIARSARPPKILRILDAGLPSHPLMRERAAALREQLAALCGKRCQEPFVRST